MPNADYFETTENSAFIGRKRNSPFYENAKILTRELFGEGRYAFNKKRLSQIVANLEKAGELEKLTEIDQVFLKAFFEKMLILLDSGVKWMEVELQGFVEKFNKEEMAFFKEVFRSDRVLQGKERKKMLRFLQSLG